MFSILRRIGTKPVKPNQTRLTDRCQTQLLFSLCRHIDGVLSPEEERALQLQLDNEDAIQVAVKFFHTEQILHTYFKSKDREQPPNTPPLPVQSEQAARRRTGGPGWCAPSS